MYARHPTIIMVPGNRSSRDIDEPTALDHDFGDDVAEDNYVATNLTIANREHRDTLDVAVDASASQSKDSARLKGKQRAPEKNKVY